MTVASKALIKAFYGRGPRLSYMAEGGGGTIAALSSAQRYPDDYDTIAVTGMSSYLTRHTFGQMWVWQATHKDAASFIPPDKYPVLHQRRTRRVRRARRPQGRRHRRRRALQVRSGRRRSAKTPTRPTA